MQEIFVMNKQIKEAWKGIPIDKLADAMSFLAVGNIEKISMVSENLMLNSDGSQKGRYIAQDIYDETKKATIMKIQQQDFESEAAMEEALYIVSCSNQSISRVIDRLLEMERTTLLLLVFREKNTEQPPGKPVNKPLDIQSSDKKKDKNQPSLLDHQMKKPRRPFRWRKRDTLPDCAMKGRRIWYTVKILFVLGIILVLMGIVCRI